MILLFGGERSDFCSIRIALVKQRRRLEAQFVTFSKLCVKAQTETVPTISPKLQRAYVMLVAIFGHFHSFLSALCLVKLLSYVFK